MPGLVLLLRPSGLHQAKGGIERIAAGIVSQAAEQRVARYQTQAQAGLPTL